MWATLKKKKSENEGPILVAVVFLVIDCYDIGKWALDDFLKKKERIIRKGCIKY